MNDSVDFRLLFEISPHLLLILRPDAPTFTILGATDAYLATAAKTREEIIGRPIFSVFPEPPDAEATGKNNVTASFNRVIQTRAADTMPVQRYDVEDGTGGFTARYWSVFNTPAFGPDGQILYIVHRVEDVTAFVQGNNADTEKHAGSRDEILQRSQELGVLNERLRLANDKLAQVDRMKTEFFSNVSHEFRTPLTLMLGPLEEHLRRHDDERIAIARRNALRLLKLVNSLLDFASIEAGRADADFRPVDLTQATTDLASAFQSAADEAGLELAIRCAPLPQPVYVDRDMWEKIVFNLISNALKFTFTGRIEISLHARGTEAELTIRDTGVGIPAPELPRIFERFHRVPGTRSRTHEGTGIGLSLVAELVKQHNGRIDVVSAENQGSTFTVLIPFGSAQLVRATSAHHTSAGSTSTAIGAAPFVEEARRWMSPASPSRSEKPGASRIVIVDDNADMRAYLRELLVDEWTVEVHSSGAVARSAILESPPDLIISDVMMAGLDGFGLVKSLRLDDRTRSLPIILLSARAGERATIEGLEAGADDYIIKPFSGRELIARIRAQLTTARLRHEVAVVKQAFAEERTRVERFQSVGKLAGGIAHDFNNLLTAILGYTELLLEEAALDPAQRENMLDVRDAAERAARLTQQLLSYGQRQVLKPRTVKLGDLFERLHADFLQTSAPTVSVDLTRAQTLPPVIADVRQLEIALEQLVANARHPTLGTTRVTVTADARLLTAPEAAEGSTIPPGPYVVLSVADDGPGITPPLRASIFEPFFTTKKIGEGSGLGLPAVMGFVRQSGAYLRLQTTPGLGSTFSIYLPVDVPPAQPQPRPTATKANRTVLLVEDEPTVLNFISKILGSRGFQVLAAQDSTEAITLADETVAVDLIITDVFLAQIDGTQLARRLSLRHPSARIVYISGQPLDPTTELTLADQNAAFIQKPFLPAAFLSRVESLLQNLA